MSESRKTASPYANSKEKSSLPEIDFGKDFLGSWKSMSGADDGMDFDFGPTTEGKKKAFKFDKMDIDFSLDADFDKLSSFKMDMSALDISSPLKKSEKSKEGSEEVSSGGEHRANKDSFALPFDFEEFADFDFEPRNTKINEKSNKSKDKEGHPNTSGSGGASGLLAKDVDAAEDDDMSSTHLASQDVAVSKVDTQMDLIKDSDPRNEDDHLKSGIDESCLLKPAMAEEQEIHKTISPEEIISCSVQEPIQESHSSEKRSSPESHAQHVVQDLYDHSLVENVSTEGTISDVQEEEFRTVVRMASSSTGADQNGNVRNVANLVPTRSSSFENSSEHMNSQSQKGEMSKVMEDNVLIGHINGDDTSKADSHLESSMPPGMENLSHGEMIDKRNADSNLKLHMGSLDSGTTVDELQPENERGNIRGRSYFMRRDGSESDLQQASVSSIKLISVGNKRMSTIPNNPALEEREFGSRRVESGSKFTFRSKSPPKVLSRDIPVQIVNTETGHVKSLDDTRQFSNADDIKPRNEPMMTTVPHDVDSTKEKPVSRSDVHPSSSIEVIELSKKDLSKDCLNPGLQAICMTSTRSMSKISIEKNRISPTKAEMRTSEVSSLKVTRQVLSLTKECLFQHKKVYKPVRRATEQKLKPINCLLPKGGLTSIRSKEQGLELQGSMVLKRNPSVDTKKQTPSTPTLKRKTFEESAEIPRLTPLKRVSASPRSNKIREAEKVVDKQACNHANVADEKKSPGLNVSVTEMDISSVLENDGIVEKAEACSKELADICNMLKKKHEEAKDVLVRAIVNNNNLLMLNHPMYQDKVRIVQKFAALLMSE